MTSIAAVNLAPAVSVALVGAALAALAAALVWVRGRRRGAGGQVALQRAIAVLCLLLTLDLVVFGAFTRLMDAGLGCPDWPGCYGETSPWQAHPAIAAAHEALPSGPVSPMKAWIEMLHRYLATAVGALITAMMLWSWRTRRQVGGLSPQRATVLFAWVCLQGLFGALTVTSRLQPLVVSLHLLGALTGVSLLSLQVQAMNLGERRWRERVDEAVQVKRRHVALVFGLVLSQSALGAWVSSNYAVLACSEFPLCQGQWWPEMDWQTPFRLWRPLGEDGTGAAITLQALTAIHMAHRMMAFAVLAAVLWLAWRWRRQGRRQGEAEGRIAAREARLLWLLAGWQVATGLSNVVLGWPLLAALGHTLGAALLVSRLSSQLMLTRRAPQEVSNELGGLACPTPWYPPLEQAR